MVTRSVVEPVLDAGPSGVAVSSIADFRPSVVAGVSLLADVDTLDPKMERLSVASSSPEAMDFCVRTTANVDEGNGTTSMGLVHAVVQMEGGLCDLSELIDHVNYCALWNVFR